MQTYRPVGVTVIAILHLVFGGLGLLLDTCGLAMQLVGQEALLKAVAGPQAARQAELQTKMIEERLPANKLITVAEMGVQLALDVMLLIAGIGLLAMRSSGRQLSIVYGFASIVNRVVHTAYTTIILMPVMTDVMKVMMEQPGQPNPMAGLMSSMAAPMSFMTILVALVYLVYPITVLVIMFHPVTVAAFKGGGRVPDIGQDWDQPYSESAPEHPDRGPPDDRYRSGDPGER